MKPRGYLVFTTHDEDEVDATFVPEDQEEILKILRRSNDPVSEFSEWVEIHHKEEWYLRWHTQTACAFEWPFNDHHILGTFYHIVY